MVEDKNCIQPRSLEADGHRHIEEGYGSIRLGLVNLHVERAACFVPSHLVRGISLVVIPLVEKVGEVQSACSLQVSFQVGSLCKVVGKLRIVKIIFQSLEEV